MLKAVAYLKFKEPIAKRRHLPLFHMFVFQCVSELTSTEFSSLFSPPFCYCRVHIIKAHTPLLLNYDYCQQQN